MAIHHASRSSPRPVILSPWLWFGLTEIVSLRCSDTWWKEGLRILETQGSDAWRTWMYGA